MRHYKRHHPDKKYKATCSDCEAETKVSFKPINGKPIYCRDCYQKHKKNKYHRSSYWHGIEYGTRDNEKHDEKYHKETISKNIFVDEDCFKVLGLKPTATNEEIKKLYKQHATMYHPDRAINEGMKSFHNQKMSELNEAYQKIKKIKGIY